MSAGHRSTRGGTVARRKWLLKYPEAKVRLYLAGPMRGYKDYNFPAFDYAAKLLRAEGYFVFSPADNDRSKGRKDPPIRDCLLDDTHWICKHADVVALLPGWEKSTGAQAERSLALALGLSITILGRKYYV